MAAETNFLAGLRALAVGSLLPKQTWPSPAAALSVDERQLFERLESVRSGLSAGAGHLSAEPTLEVLGQELAMWREISRLASAIVVCP